MDRNAESSAQTLLLIADDLMMPSRVREGARPLGYAVQVAGGEAAALAAAASDPAPAAILVSLTARRYDAPALIRALKADTTTASIPLLAFAGHVEKQKHEAARTAGADLVAANSSVILHLDRILPRLLRVREMPGDASAAELLSFGDEEADAAA